MNPPDHTLSLFVGKAGTFRLGAEVAVGARYFAFYLVPETNGKSLEEIEAHGRAGKHPLPV